MNLKNANKNKQRKVKWILWLMILFFLLMLSACGDGQQKKPKKKNYIEQDGYIKFELGGEKFKVPKGYFRGVGETQWGSLVYVKFWALLPDFEAYDKSKNHKAFVEELGWGDKLYFRLHSSSVGRNSVPRIIETNKTERGGLRFSGRLGKPNEIKYGLEVYYTDKKTHDDYLYRSEGIATIYITCSSKVEEHPSPGCRMIWDYSNSIYADADFHMKYLPQWQSILKQINNQIKG